MTIFALDGKSNRLQLTDRVVLTTPPMTGVLRDVAPSEGRPFTEAAFDAALEAAGLELHKAIEMEVADVPSARGFAAAPESALGIEVASPPGLAALVLVEDESGAVTWHVPETAPAAGLRGFAEVGVNRFSIAITPPAAPSGARFLGGLFKKILKVFVYPITDFIVGTIAKPIVRFWESNNRPYQLRTYTTQNYRIDRSKVPALAHADWTHLNGGRSLLFVHGTFSSSDAFRDMSQATLAALESAYKGRLFAFNHPTLGDDPTANVEKLLELVPRELRLNVDIVSHSRGGLVARELATTGQGRLNVGKLVMVGVPNRGTVLADADHVVGFIDRFTTITKLVPGTVGTLLDAIVFVVKVLAHGLISQLAGLTSMDPGGAYLKRLQAREGLASPDYHAIASDYEPKPGTALFNIARAADAVADSAFGQAGNDLVVPSAGASQLRAGLDVPRSKVFAFGPADAVIHTDFFSQERTGTQLKTWLNGAATGDASSRAFLSSRAARIPPDVLRTLHPHVVNLSEGAFHSSGQYTTLPSDVKEIFDVHLPKWIESRTDESQAPRVMIWAHGGLIGEQAGLEIARKHVAWWLQNDVYPIYFVWETGLIDAIRSVAQAAAAKFSSFGKRDLRENTTDPVIERACRMLGGVQLWGAMKLNAARASEPAGGAYFVAERLAEARKRYPQLEVHAAGHSAGSIFHSHFLKCAIERDAGPIASLHLLAPAIRIDEFTARLLPLMSSKQIARTTMYTMAREYELADECFGVYGKSLLYLIHHALEREAREPILGLEMSLRDDPAAARAFGLDGRTEHAEVIWSRTDAESGDSASRSDSHGGFDDDPATLGSIAARVLGRAEPLVAYPSTRAVQITVAEEWLYGVDTSGAEPAPRIEAAAPPAATATSTVVTGGVANDTFPSAVTAPNGSGRKLALCVGIDAYPGANALQGCVNDARRWAEYLGRVGFEVTRLRDDEATHRKIVTTLESMLKSASAGDSVVFQYAGHGYHVPDLDGDEVGGEDQALVPFDFDDGAFLIDDELRELLRKTPSGVRVTCFMDCCHSGTNSRLLMSGTPAQRSGKRRFLALDEAQRRAVVDKYMRVRSSMRRDATARSFGQDAMTWVSFAACQDSESALEHDGSGDFTRIALDVLTGSRSALRHGEFFDLIQSGFPPPRVQTPVLDCPANLRDSVLFQVG